MNLKFPVMVIILVVVASSLSHNNSLLKFFFVWAIMKNTLTMFDACADTGAFTTFEVF